jgi:pyroglutamyl-peptidase
MTTVLLTGFEPFGGASSNSSWDAVHLVAQGWHGAAALVTACLPVEFGRAGDALDSLIAEHKPDIVIATGVANGRTALTPERVAINLVDARIPDNAGALPTDEAVVTGGPDAYFTRLPVRTMVERMTVAGIPAEISLSAGGYVCNATMYRLLHGLADRETVAGFIHVPDSNDLPLETIAAGLREAIATVLDRFN